MSPDRGDRPVRIRAVLGGLVDGKRILGAAVLSRDGLPVQAQLARPASEEVFCAMAAALLGAAEGALQEWADERPMRASVDGPTVRIFLEGLDDEFALAAVAPVTEASPALAVAQAATQLRAVLAS